MSRLKNFFAQKKTYLIPFITAGDPDFETSLNVFKALPSAGADIIELGMPFSDPMAEGVPIQLASQRALQAGQTMHKTLKMVKAFRESNQTTPVVLMGYYNPLLTFGLEAFAKAAAESGVDAVLIVDLPPEMSFDLEPFLKREDIDLIRLCTPTTSLERFKRICEGASGFLYYVSIAGVTGAAVLDKQTVKARLQALKAETDLPIVVGFGIKTPSDVAAFKEVADGVVVGSAVVEKIRLSAKGQEVEAVTTFLKELKQGVS